MVLQLPRISEFTDAAECGGRAKREVALGRRGQSTGQKAVPEELGEVGLKTMSGSGASSKNRMQRWKEDNDQQIQKEFVVEAGLDEEMRGLQAGDERRGSCASQRNERCMDPTFLHSFFHQEQIWPGSRLCFAKTSSGKRMERSISPRLQCLSRREEKKMRRRRAASGENGPPVPGSRNERFRAGSVCDTSVPPRNTGEGDGDEFGSSREGDGGRGRQVQKEKNCYECRDAFSSCFHCKSYSRNNEKILAQQS